MLKNDSFIVHDGRLARCRGEKKTYMLQRDGAKIGSVTAWDTTRVAEVTIPKGVRAIQYGAFDGFEALKIVHISDGVQQIRGGFEQCRALEDIYLPDSLTFLSPYSFPSKATIHVRYKRGDWRRLWSHKHRPLSELQTPPTAAMIAMDYVRRHRGGQLELEIEEPLDMYEFLNCDVPFEGIIKSSIIGESAKYIFQGSQAKVLRIGKELAYIHPSALGVNDIMCSEVELEGIHVDYRNEHYYSRDGVLFTKDGELLRFPPMKSFAGNEAYTIPKDTTSIHPDAFKNTYFLRKMIIPKGLEVDETRLRQLIVDLEEIVYI